MLKSRLARGEVLLGSFLKTPSPILVEVLAGSGLDCLCVDAEHAPFDRAAIDLCAMAARASNFPLLVRPASGSSEQILNALDVGADGVLVPHVRTAAEARALSAAANYQPGGRGYAGSTRAAGYGLTAMEEHRARSAERTTVIAQIEDREALDEIDQIAAEPGIDALFIGRADLTVSLGATTPDDPVVLAAVQHIIAACRVANRPLGMFVPRNEDVPRWREQGVTLFIQGSDHTALRAGAQAMRSACGL